MRSLIRSWQSQNLRPNGLSTGGNLSLPPGTDPGRGHGGTNSMPPDFDVSHVKTEPDSGGLPHNQSLGGSGNRQGFGPDMSDSNVGFQSPGNPSDNSVSNAFQFGALLSGQGSGGKGAGLLNMLGEQTASSKKQRKRSKAAGDGIWRSPKRKQTEDCEIVLESSSSDSTPLGTPTSRDAPMETSLDCEDEKPGSEFGEEEIMPIEEVEEMIVKKPKKEKKSSPPTIILDIVEGKNIVPPSVSITPITSSSSSFNSVLSGMGLERRPGIEIIPIGSTPATSLPTSITITPISKGIADERNNRERKSGKSRTEDKTRPDKKRNKRKREDSPSGNSNSGVSMGPPDKLPHKQDPLSKPVSVSIKPTESPPLSSVRPSSPAGALRKITSSPTHMNLSMSKSSSSKQSSSHQSPKHSPGYTTSSPKHHGTSSPKHQSGGSGKPSMSALKSAASSPSSTGKSSSGDITKVKSSSNKDKDRKVSSSFSGGSSSSGGLGSSPKLKSSSVKLKQLDLSSGTGDGSQSGGGTPPSGSADGGKSASTTPQGRNRKGSLSAVIDKLKSAQHQGPESGEVVKERSSSSNPAGKAQGDASSSNTSKNPAEYMVKPSSDGMKITINKTRTKESKSGGIKSSSSTGSGSPKTHTGLKPGVNSGPASKKPHPVLQQKSTGSSSGVSNSGSSSSKTNPSSSKTQSATKSSSSPVSGILSKSNSKSSGSPKMSSLTDSSRRENKPRPPKSSSDRSDREKSVFSKGPDSRKSSPGGLRDEVEGDRLKLVSAHTKLDSSLPPQLMVEGMIKQLDTKFQIPKLSARTSNLAEGDSKKQSSEKTSAASTDTANRLDSGVKPLDLVGKGDSSNASTKYPSLSKTPDDIKGSKISPVSSVTPPLAMLGLATPLSKSTPTPTYPSISSKSQDITIDTGPEITSASTPIATNLSTSSNEPSSGDSADISRIKADLSRTGQSSNSSVKEESSSPSVGKLDNSAKSFSTSSNNDPTPLLLHSSKSLDGSQTKFSSSSQKQVEDSKKLVNLSDIPNKSASLNKIAPAITTSEEAAEILLDMSTSQSLPAKPLTTESPQGKLATVPERAVAASAPSRRNTPPPPPPPSVQVHIVQSPAAAPTTASPMVIPSPHSASPCSIDDDLMDEALVGLGK